MKNLKNSIVAAIVAVLCVNQYLAAEYAVVNATDSAVIISLSRYNMGAGPERSLQPNGRWIIDKRVYDNARWIRVFEPAFHVKIAGKAINQNWNTITIRGRVREDIKIEEQS